MSQPNAFFGLAPAKVLPLGQLAYQVREVHRGKVTSTLVTPYLPEALADLLLKARRPLNQPIHDGAPEDHTLTRIIPRVVDQQTALYLEVMDTRDTKMYAFTVLTPFIADGSQSTGLIQGVNAYQNPLYALTRQRLATCLLEESGFHPDVALSMTCCAASQPTHPFWQAWATSET